MSSWRFKAEDGRVVTIERREIPEKPNRREVIVDGVPSEEADIAPADQTELYRALRTARSVFGYDHAIVSIVEIKEPPLCTCLFCGLVAQGVAGTGTGTDGALLNDLLAKERIVFLADGDSSQGICVSCLCSAHYDYACAMEWIMPGNTLSMGVRVDDVLRALCELVDPDGRNWLKESDTDQEESTPLRALSYAVHNIALIENLIARAEEMKKNTKAITDMIAGANAVYGFIKKAKSLSGEEAGE